MAIDWEIAAFVYKKSGAMIVFPIFMLQATSLSPGTSNFCASDLQRSAKTFNPEIQILQNN